MSARQLKNPKAQNFITKEPIIMRNIEPVSRSLFSDNKILKYLANSNDFETIDEFRIEDEYIKSWILYKKGNYPASIKIAQDKYMEENIINFQDKRLELIYPVLFEEEINKYCTDYSQSPYLFLSLIREESHFDKYAKSPVGAIGLAQIMLNTAEFIQKKPVTKSELIKNN
ncbi:transglycosylase SLT domain-containing protein, partial [bacterium]|nr:transglycosylase SLT domain-containing protein [bacterium]